MVPCSKTEGAEMKKESARGQEARKSKRSTHRVERGSDDPAMNPATACCRHHDKHLNPDVARRAEHAMIAYGEVEGFGQG